MRKVMPAAIQIAPSGLDKTDRDRWLAIRRDAIGGSDVAAIIGLNEYKSALDVYFDKIGMGEAYRRPELEEAASFGHLMEDLIAGEFARRTGLRLLRPPGVLANVDRPWMIATLDRIVTDIPAGRVPASRKYVLEIKTRSAYQSKQWRDEPADAPAIQAQWYLAVTGLSKAYIAALIGGNSLRWYEIERDDELISELIAAAEDFRDNHLAVFDPPAADGTPSTSGLLDSIWAGDPDKIITLGGDAAKYRLMEEEAAAAEAEARQRKEEARNAVKLLMGDSEIAMIGMSPFAQWVRNGTFKSKQFRADHPELAARYTVMKSSLDTDRLAQDHPELYREYRARVLRFSGADTGEGTE